MSAVSLRRSARGPLTPRDHTFNFWALVGDVSCFFIGFAFLDSSTALPAIVDRLGGNATFLGLLLAARQGGYFLPQLVVAHRIQGRPLYLPFLLKVAFSGRACILIAAIAVLIFGARQPALALGILAVCYCSSWVGDGMGGVPWTAIVGKTVPAERRGRLFATTQLVSGAGRLLVAGVVGALLAGNIAPFPLNHSLLIFACAFFLAVSWIFLAVIREPEGDTETAEASAARGGFGVFLKELPVRFRERPAFARLAVVQVLGTASGATIPFLVAYALAHKVGGDIPRPLLALMPSLERGGLPGLFLAMQTIGLLLLAPVWGTVSDRRGPRRALLVLITMSFLSPLAALIGIFGTGLELPLFLLAYFCFGATQDGWVIITNYLLEAVPAAEQPTFIGLLNAASAPALALPMIAGVLVQVLGAASVFWFAAGLLLVGFLFARSLPDTRITAAIQ